MILGQKFLTPYIINNKLYGIFYKEKQKNIFEKKNEKKLYTKKALAGSSQQTYEHIQLQQQKKLTETTTATTTAILSNKNILY